MADENRTEDEALAAYLADFGWHQDPAQPQRWRHPAMPAIEPQTLRQAVEIQRHNSAGVERASGPDRLH